MGYLSKDGLARVVSWIKTQFATRPEIFTLPLKADGWAQNENIFEQVGSHSSFAMDGYIYHVAVAPADILVAADIGGIVMASVANGQAVFQCRKQPEADITIQIERTPQKEDT